jgi:phage-related protein (TIGR01555 family)
MLTRLKKLFRKPAPVDAPAPVVSRADKYANPLQGLLDSQRMVMQAQVDTFVRSVKDASEKIMVVMPAAVGAMDQASQVKSMSAMDDSNGVLPAFKALTVQAGAQLQLLPWFMQQGFIGYQNAAFVAQHWLIYKACAVPVDDAVRNGYEIVSANGEDIDEDALKLFKTADRKFGIKGQLRDFGIKGRIFGVRIALFEVESDDPNYYEKPFNIDGVKPGTYKGISQIDPYWCAPMLDLTSAAVPSSRHFYEPTWWQIGARRVHRSHLVIFKYFDPPDVMKPLYLFGGVPLPQMIMERVYCAERTANEAPALVLSKRTTVWMTDMAKVMADTKKAEYVIANWIANRDNFGIKIGDKETEQFQQFDTPLGEFDGLVMTQYGLVAATAGMPIAKLMGTSPTGFAATGDYEEASYHEMLESMQERDFTPLLERHHELVLRSIVLPKFPELEDVEITVTWNDLDALTHVEQAQMNLTKAQTDAALVAVGALSPKDARARVASDKESGYHAIGVDLETEELPEDTDTEAASGAAGEGSRAVKAAVKLKKDETKKGGKAEK